jgi:hypothetical protein
MKKCKYLVGLCALLIAPCLMSQTLMTLRCYFDNDTNPMQTISLGGQMSVDAPFTVSVNGLSQGVHTLYIEALNFDGNWSHYATKQVLIHGSLQMATLNLVEYYFDQEGPDASGITVALNNNTIDQTFDVSVDGLSNGTHVLFVRVRDAGGAWSIPTYRVIEVYGATYEEITEAEYFWNNDPGFGNGNTLPLDAFVVDDVFDLSTEGLANGVHLLYIRLKDAKGQWSHSKEQVVQVGSTGIDSAMVVVGEYFLDVDTGEGLGTPIEMGPAFLIDDQFDLTMPNILAAGPHWLYVRVMNEHGYWSQVVGRQINVCSINIPNVTITGASCVGSTATLTAPVGYNSYTWSTSQTGNTINVTAGGTYYLTVTDSDCSTTVPVEVNFVDSTPPQLTVSGNNCPGDTQTIAVVGNYNTYAWQGGSTGNSLVVTSPGSYSVTVNTGTCPAVASIDVTYINVPEPQINITGPSCTGSTQTMEVSNLVYDVYQWTGGPANPTYNVTTAGTYELSAQYNGCNVTELVTVSFADLASPEITISGNPCQDQSLQLSVPNVYSGYSWSNGSLLSNSLVTQSGTYTITVLDGPCEAIASVDVAFGSLDVEPITVAGTGCPGTIFTLSGANGYDSYSWSPGGTANSFINTTTAGEYTLTVTEGECEGSVSATIEYIDVTPLEVTANGSLCPGDLMTLDAGPFYDSYVWTPGNATTSFLNVTSSGTYSVQVVSDGCVQSEATVLNFYDLPTPGIAQTQNMLTCNEAGYNYQWYLNGNAIAGATNQFWNATVSGNYTVSISIDACSEVSANYFFQYIGLDESLQSAVDLFPNPATNIFYVRNALGTYTSITVMDVTGRVVFQDRLQDEIDISTWSNGVYFVRLIGAQHEKTLRLEKAR